MNDYMTVKEVMEFLGVARPTVYKYVSQRRLHPFHKGKSKYVYFKRSEVEEAFTTFRPIGEEAAPAYRPDEAELAELLDRIQANEGKPGITHDQAVAEFSRFYQDLKRRREQENKAPV